jgi:hypothetical protein
VAPHDDRDPILEAYHLWIDNGWEECAVGVTAVTSLMRVHQVLAKQADQVLAPIDLTFSRYELLVRLYFLNSELYRDLGLTGDEGRQLIGLLMKMRLSWDDIENPAGWEPFEAPGEARG